MACADDFVTQHDVFDLPLFAQLLLQEWLVSVIFQGVRARVKLIVLPVNHLPLLHQIIVHVRIEERPFVQFLCDVVLEVNLAVQV